MTIVADNAIEIVTQLHEQSGEGIWLFGGPFSSLAGEGLVDTVGASLMPVILGKGLPLAPDLAGPLNLTLIEHKLYNTSGIVSLRYPINRSRTS